MDRGASEDVPVLIVGGSLVGLSAALFLRWHGVDVLAVERHTGTAINVRAGQFRLRTVEILRSAGLEDAVLGRAGATGRLRGLAGPRSVRRARTGSPADAPDAAMPGRRQAMNSESERRKKVHSWHTCIARTSWGRFCARST